MADGLLKFATVLYVLASFSYLGMLVVPRLKTERASIGLLFGALALHVGGFVLTILDLGHLEVGLGGGLSVMAFLVASLWVAVHLKIKRPIIGAFVTPLVVVAMITSVMIPAGESEIPESLRSVWLPIHISMAFLGDAALAIAAAVAVIYLFTESKMKRKDFGGVGGRLPSLETLDSLNFNLVRFGFVLLSMAIITGTLWAGQLWESYFDWEPRQTSAMVAWILYAALLGARWLVGWRGRRAAMITLMGFFLMVGSFVTLKLLDLGRHASTYT